MKVELRFNSTTKQMIIIPETGRDKALLKMFSEDSRYFKADVKKDDTFVIEPSEIQGSPGATIQGTYLDYRPPTAAATEPVHLEE
jgi:hypothetical protein